MRRPWPWLALLVWPWATVQLTPGRVRQVQHAVRGMALEALAVGGLAKGKELEPRARANHLPRHLRS